MGQGVAALAGIPGSIKGSKLEQQAQANRNAQMLAPNAFEIDSMPWVLDQYKGLYNSAMAQMPTDIDMQRYAGLTNTQYDIANMLAQKALSGNAEQTDLQYAKSRDDAINQAMAMAASRNGRTGLAAREIGGLSAGYNQDTARDMALSRLNETAQNTNMANQSLGFLHDQQSKQFQRAEDSVYRGLGGFYGALENDRQARISREHLRLGQSGIGTSPNPGASAASLYAGGKAADSGLGTVMSLMSMFGFGGGGAVAGSSGKAGSFSTSGGTMGSYASR